MIQLDHCDISEYLLNLRQTLPGNPLDPDEEPAGRRLNRGDGKPAVIPAHLHMAVSVLNGFDDIGDHCAGRRKHSRAAAIEHGGSKHVALHQNSVEHIAHRVKWMVLADHDRRHPGVNLPILYAAGAKQLHGGSQLLCILKVHV